MIIGCAVNVNANTPAYAIAVPIVVGILAIGILTIIITKLILMYQVRLEFLFGFLNEDNLL